MSGQGLFLPVTFQPADGTKELSMPIDSIDLLKARLNSIKATLERASEKQKGGPAGTALAENFNRILEEVGTAFPELKSALPARITSLGPLARVGSSDVSYLDLEVFAEQVLSLLQFVQRKS
jgi:hypothetical protein